MEDTQAIAGALIFIGLVVGANFIVYAIARGAARSNQAGFWEALGRSLNASARKRDDSIDELHRRVEELEQGKKGRPRDS
jgi:hypothetical protein